jgi:hypothetical protein
VVGRNTWRVVYRVTDDKSVEICEVWAVGERADAEVYAEATARVRAAGDDRPEVVQLGKVIERLGTLADHIRVDEPPPREPVPDWLADRLIYTVGMPREDVAALDLQKAVCCRSSAWRFSRGSGAQAIARRDDHPTAPGTPPSADPSPSMFGKPLLPPRKESVHFLNSHAGGPGGSMPILLG